MSDHFSLSVSSGTRFHFNWLSACYHGKKILGPKVSAVHGNPKYNNNSYHLLSASCLPGTILDSLAMILFNPYNGPVR